MKTWGYLIAIESEEDPGKDVIADGIKYYLDDDNDYKLWGYVKVDVEALGQLDVYPEEASSMPVSSQGPTDRELDNDELKRLWDEMDKAMITEEPDGN